MNRRNCEQLRARAQDMGRLIASKPGASTEALMLLVVAEIQAAQLMGLCDLLEAINDLKRKDE